MYYLVKITHEDAQNTQVIFAYDTEKVALMAYHQELAGAMAYDTVKTCLCMLIDDLGRVLTQEKYERDGQVPEAEAATAE